MRKRIGYPISVCVLAVLFGACAGATRANGSSSDRNRLTAEEIASVDVQTLYEVVQRLRPRWLEVRAPRSGFSGDDTLIVVYMDRTLLGGPVELSRLGPEIAASLQYMTGSAAAAELPGIQSRHVEGAIIVHTVARR